MDDPKGIGRLPTEIRQMILKMAFDEGIFKKSRGKKNPTLYLEVAVTRGEPDFELYTDYSVHEDVWIDRSPRRMTIHPKNAPQNALALLHVCRELRLEAYQVLFLNTTLEIDMTKDHEIDEYKVPRVDRLKASLELVAKFLAQTPKAKTIRRLVLPITAFVKSEYWQRYLQAIEEYEDERFSRLLPKLASAVEVMVEVPAVKWVQEALCDNHAIQFTNTELKTVYKFYLHVNKERYTHLGIANMKCKLYNILQTYMAQRDPSTVKGSNDCCAVKQYKRKVKEMTGELSADAQFLNSPGSLWQPEQLHGGFWALL